LQILRLFNITFRSYRAKNISTSYRHARLTICWRIAADHRRVSTTKARKPARFTRSPEGKKIWRSQLVVAPFHRCHFRIRDISLRRGRRERRRDFKSSGVPRHWSSCGENASKKKRRGLLLLTGADGDSILSPLLIPFLPCAFSCIGIHRALWPTQYMNIITGYILWYRRLTPWRIDRPRAARGTRVS